MNNNSSLKGIEWGSSEFIKIVENTTNLNSVSVDKRRVDNLINRLKTDEGWEYLKRNVAEYYGH